MPLGKLIEKRDLIRNLVSRELKSRYKGSALGVLWSLLTPLFMAVIYVFFLRLLSRGVPVEQIIIGVFAWQFTVQAVQTGMESITGNSNLVKKVFFPRIILPLSTTLAALVNYLLSLLVQFAVVGLMLVLHDSFFTLGTLLLPVVIIYHALFNLGLALCLSSANVYFRDTQHLVGVFMSAWFFLSPAMYHLELVETVAQKTPWIMNLYMLNPLAVIITAYRALQLDGVTFPWSPYVIVGIIWPLLFLPLAYRIFKKSQRNFADLL